MREQQKSHDAKCTVAGETQKETVYRRSMGALRVGILNWLVFSISFSIGSALLSLRFTCGRSLHERRVSCQVGICPSGSFSRRRKNFNANGTNLRMTQIKTKNLWNSSVCVICVLRFLERQVTLRRRYVPQVFRIILGGNSALRDRVC